MSETTKTAEPPSLLLDDATKEHMINVFERWLKDIQPLLDAVPPRKSECDVVSMAFGFAMGQGLSWEHSFAFTDTLAEAGFLDCQMGEDGGALSPAPEAKQSSCGGGCGGCGGKCPGAGEVN